MNIHDRRETQKLEKKTVALEKIRSEATKVLKFLGPFRVDISESAHSHPAAASGTQKPKPRTEPAVPGRQPHPVAPAAGVDLFITGR
jgi:hypothetical protein